jgi:hypothetical protein
LAAAAKIPALAREPEKSDSISMTAAEALLNAPEFTVSELSSALKRTVEDAAKSPVFAGPIPPGIAISR